MKRTSSIILIVIFGLTLLVYSSVLISPQTLRISGFISLLVPVFILLNVVLAIFYLFKLSRKALLPILAVLIGYKFIFLTFSLSGGEASTGHFSVLSYNIKWLVESEKGGGFDKAVSWISADDATIKCFQEFHSRKDVVDKISREGTYQMAAGGRSNTLAIFSKFNILNSDILFSSENINNVLFADLLVDSDTIRIYNVHLESMGIDVSEVPDSEEIRAEYDKVKNKFLRASVERAEQIGVLLEHISKCDYPVIISGDFNDVPYSNNHFRLKRQFDNAFEEAGSGFGFTFNGGIPFLRIDNQFFNEKIRVFDFETISDTYFSDHFPIKGQYSVLE